MSADGGMGRLRELVDRLPVPLTALAVGHGTTVSYQSVGGDCAGIGLLNNGAVAVQAASMSRGALLPSHAHEEQEVLIVYEGRMSVSINDGHPREYGPGGVAIIPPGTAHVVKALERTAMVAVTVPAADGYPMGKETGEEGT